MRSCCGRRLRLPAVGERRLERPFFGLDNLTRTIPCTVIYVNEAHGWYTVRFDAGYREAYHTGSCPGKPLPRQKGESLDQARTNESL